MLILLLTWAILLVVCLAITEWLMIRYDDLFLRFLLGLAALSIYLQFWAVFWPLKFSLIPLLIPVSLSFFIPKIRAGFYAIFKGFYGQVNIYGALILLLVLILATMPSFLNDDAAYYQQTIKWFSGYGYVPGIANLKMHFGLASSWHLLASAFYIDDLPFTRYYNFNGLVLLLFIVSLMRNQEHKTTALTVVLIIGSLFVNAPSPDLLVIVSTVWIFLNYKRTSPVYLAVIIGFLITVKVTAVGLLLIFLPLYKLLKKKNVFFQVVGITSFFIFLLFIKNIILTGQPLFPLNISEGFGDHHVPGALLEMFRNDVLLETFDWFAVDLNNYDIVNNYIDRFRALFMVRSYKVLMNTLCLLSFIVTPILLIRRGGYPDKLLAAVIFINGVFWFWQAPNYRFVLGFVIYMFFLLLRPYVLKNYFLNLKPFLFTSSVVLILIFIIRSNEVLYRVNCGIKNEITIEELLYPSPYNQITYYHQNAFNITECAYCYDIQLPCYSNGVTDHYIRKRGYNVMYLDKDNVSKGFKMVKIDNRDQ